MPADAGEIKKSARAMGIASDAIRATTASHKRALAPSPLPRDFPTVLAPMRKAVTFRVPIMSRSHYSAAAVHFVAACIGRPWEPREPPEPPQEPAGTSGTSGDLGDLGERGSEQREATQRFE
jgi:hypothetical protein